MILYDYEVDWCGSYGTHVVNWSEGLPTGLTLIHGRGMTRHISKAEVEHEALHLCDVWVPMKGRCVKFQRCAAF